MRRVSDKYVDVRFLDFPAFWEMVKETESYRIRNENGRTPTIEDCLFTRSELQVEKELVVAIRKGSPYVDGEQYNSFLKEYYDHLRPTIKRGEGLTLCRKRVLSILLRDKAALVWAKAYAVEIPDFLIEQAIHEFVEHKILDIDFTMPREEPPTISQVMKNERRRARRKHSDEIKSLSKALQELDLPLGGQHLVHFISGRYARRAIAQSFRNAGDEEIYAWMKAEKRKEPFHLAQQKYMDAKAEALLEKMTDELHITFVDTGE